MWRRITVLSVVVGVLFFSSAGFAAPQVLEVSPTFLGFSASAGGANPASQVLSIWNSGHAQMGWTVTPDCNWIAVEPNSGTSSGEVDDVNVIVDITGLSAGTYNCELTVDAGTAVNSPRIVGIALTVGDNDGQLHVPSEYATIQMAVDLALDGDTVILAEGTYTGSGNRDIDFLGKAIEVRSADPNNPMATVIDCGSGGRGFYFHSGEDFSSKLSGITITGGYASNGGAIYCNQSSPVIEKCILIGNVATTDGGGIYCRKNRTRVIGCVISDNQAYEDGGGLRFGGASPYQDTGTITVINCTVINNYAQRYGGGIYWLGGWGGNVKVINSIVWDNNAGVQDDGIFGGVGIFYSDVQSRNFSDSNNISIDPMFVADFHIASTSPCIDNGDPNYDQITETDIDGEPRIFNGRIDMGADEYNLQTLLIDISTHELSFSAKQDGPNPEAQILEIRSANPGALLQWEIDEDCDWLGVDPRAGTSNGPYEVNEVTVSIDTNGLSGGEYFSALLISDPNALNSPQTVNVVLNIQGPRIGVAPGSIAITGVEGSLIPDQVLYIHNEGGGILNWSIEEECSWMEAVPDAGSSAGEIDEVTLSVDIEGLGGGLYSCELMVSDPNADNSPQIVQVSLHVTDADNTLYVPNEYSTIQAAINTCDDGDIVIISPGIYTGAGNKNLDFGGKAITVRSIDPEDPCVVAATVIDCENVGRGFYFHSGENANSIVAGLTVKNGRIIGTPINFDAYGGGIYCSDASPTIANCSILNNLAYGWDCTHCGGQLAGYAYGGGISCISNSHPAIINCEISGNLARAPYTIEGWANAYGGGIYCSSGSTVAIYDSRITSNIAHGGKWMSDASFLNYGLDSFGGGVYISGSSTIKNCIIANNQTVVVSGEDYEGPNYGLSQGAGIYSDGNVTIKNCSICNNNTDPTDTGFLGEGGGIYGAATVKDSIIWANLATNQIQGSASVTYSDVQGGYAGVGNINADPCFVTGPEGDYYLSQIAAGQAVDSPCVDAGSDTSHNLGMRLKTTRTDGFGDDGIVDMGYHYPFVIDPDLDGDLFIDFVDYAIFAADWQQPPDPCDPNSGDITKDGQIDISDLAQLVAKWLDCLVISVTDTEPADNAINVSTSVVLRWVPRQRYVSHNVYFGTDFNEVSDADISNSNVFMGNQTDTFWDTNNYDSNGLEYYTTYYWRIDEVAPGCNARGNVWGFKTEHLTSLVSVSRWMFDEGMGTIAYDSAGDNDGQLVNGPTWTTGHFNGALSFDGLNDYVLISNQSPFNFGYDWDFTVSAWVNTASTAFRMIAVSKKKWEGTYPRYPGFELNVREGMAEVRVCDDLGNYLTCVGDTLVNNGQWHFIAAVGHRTGSLQLYTNGTMENSKPMSQVGNISNDVPLAIGRNMVLSIYYFEGAIDDVRIYNRALSAEEILQLYLGGL